MRKLMKLFATSFLLGSLASPLPVFANPGGINWSTSNGSNWYTPGSGIVANQFLQTTPANANFALDVTSSPVFLSGTAPTSPTDGQVWNDSTRITLERYSNGMTESMPGVIYSSTGSAITATTAESTMTALMTTFYGTNTLPANSLPVGKIIRYRVIGEISTIPTSPGTLKINVKFGTTTVMTTGAVTPLANLSSATFTLDGVVVSTAAGNFLTGSVSGGFCLMISSTASPFNPFNMCSNPVAPPTFDTTVANDFNLTVTWGTSSGSNIFRPKSIVYYREN